MPVLGSRQPASYVHRPEGQAGRRQICRFRTPMTDGVIICGFKFAVEIYFRFPLHPLRGRVGRSGEKVDTFWGYLSRYAGIILLFLYFKRNIPCYLS